VIAEKIANLDRRVEESGRKIEERLSRHSDHQDRHLLEIKKAQRDVEQQVHSRIDDEVEKRTAAEREVGQRMTDIERTVQMVKGGIGVLIAIGGLTALERAFG
jgi:hypothetical protein